MRTQISRAILAVAVLLVLGLGLPLLIVVQRFYEDGAAASLQRRAAQTLVEISLPLDRAELQRVVDEPDSPGRFTVYDASGQRLIGPGEDQGDASVQEALAGRASSAGGDRQRVLALPITDRTSEEVVGAVLVTQPSNVVAREVHRAWLIMGLAVIVALAGATGLARRQGRYLAAPVARLAEHAAELGRGEFTSRVEPSGIAEVDTVASALNQTAGRLADLLARERAFSSDVSHQLRTPLTGLRLRLERATTEGGPNEHLEQALNEVARLEVTVEHLLALSRDRHPLGMPLAVPEMLTGTVDRWRARFEGAGRVLRLEAAHRPVSVRGSDVSISQVLDVLIQNSLDHGADTTTIRSRVIAGGLVVEVQDEGVGIADDRRELIFDRHEGHGHGIGLSLARSITEAEGGRLLLASGQPPCFQVILPVAD